MQQHNQKKTFGCLIIGFFFFLSLVCIIGIAFASSLILLNTSRLVARQPQNVQIKPYKTNNPQSQQLPDEGFSIVNKGNYVKILKNSDDRFLDLSSIPTVSERKASFAIKGDDYNLDKLRFHRYVAGIGVDVSFRTAGAVINRVVENSPAASAGLQNGDIVTQVNQKPVQQILAQPVITFQNGRNDIIGLMNGKTTLTVLTGTRTRNVDVIGAFHENSDGKSRQVTMTDIPFSIETKADYVLIHVYHDLVPGVYYFEFQRDESIGVGENQPNNSDSSSAPRTDNLHTDKWIFQVH